VFIYVILLLGGQAGRRAGDDILYRLMRKPFLIGLPLSFDPWTGKTHSHSFSLRFICPANIF
jgi:hypothetical protein